MFLNLPGIVFQPISADVTRQTIKEHFLLRYGIKLLAHTGLTCSDATCEMSRQPTLAKFGFKKRIDHRGLQQDINLLDFVAKTPKKFTCSTCSKAFNLSESEVMEDKYEDRDFSDKLVGSKVTALYENGWFTGTIEYYNAKLKEYKVNYLDNTSDFVSPDDFDGVEVILEQL